MPVLVALMLVPVLEMVALIAAGAAVGVWATLAYVVAGATAGTLLIRGKAATIFGQTMATLNEGGFPLDRMVDGACTVLAGFLLAIPGPCTDLLALALLVPRLRRWAGRRFLALVRRHGEVKVRVWGRTVDVAAAEPEPDEEPPNPLPPPEPPSPDALPDGTHAVGREDAPNSRWRPANSRFRPD